MSAETIAKYLESKGFGTFDAVEADIFIGFKPDEPDNIVFIDDVSAPQQPESNAFAVDIDGVSITVRNLNYLTAKETCKAIHRELVGFGGKPLMPGTEYITEIRIGHPPVSNGRDEHANSRAEWSAEYHVRRMTEGDPYRA